MDAPILTHDPNLRFTLLRRSHGGTVELKYSLLTRSGNWVKGQIGLKRGAPMSEAFTFLKDIIALHRSDHMVRSKSRYFTYNKKTSA